MYMYMSTGTGNLKMLVILKSCFRPVQFFIAEPPEIVFTDYQIGRSYEASPQYPCQHVYMYIELYTCCSVRLSCLTFIGYCGAEEHQWSQSAAEDSAS